MPPPPYELADLGSMTTLVDPAGSYLVDPDTLASRSRNTPFAGRLLPAAVVATFLRGRITAGSLAAERSAR